MTMTIAIVGMGPWGLCILDRILHRARSAGHVSLQVHTIEPGVPGAGAHGLDQPAYLLLNTVCGQVNPFCGAGFGENGGGTDSPSLYGWARDRGYRMADGDWRQGGTDGRPVTPDDFLPRRVAGEYLAWAYAKLLESRPGNVTLHHHAAEAVDIRPAGSDGERLTLSTGESLAADHVFLTTGHTPQTVGAAASMGGPALPPDPASFGADAVPVASTVAIAGMGLAATDALAGLTIGRGGRFEALEREGREQEGGEQGTRLRYRPSGGEPRILLFSRQGLPFLSRPSTSLDASGAYRPVIVTQEEIDARRERRRNRSGSDRLDFRADILPLLWAEMTVVFHSRSALLADGAEAADAVARTLGHAWRTGGFEDCAAGYAARHGAFDPETAFFCPAIRGLPDSAAYQAAVRSMLVQDIGQSRLGEADSPVKAALELFRVLRPQIRSAVDFGGLTPDSHRDFRTGIAPLINRAVIGPPLSRNEELLALIDAGIVRAPFGPAPDCRFDSSLRRWTITSTALGLPHCQTADRLIAGHLDQPEVEGTASPLLSALAGAGRIRAYRHGDAPTGGIDIDRDSHPLDRAGRPQPRLWVLGPLTEGVRYFNHYLPSPKSRSKAFAEADACLDRILGEQGGTGAPVPAAAFRGLVGQDA